ncbi:hypothetical protein [Pyrococcus yayanosii]|uniref:Uncharacterized protein n=1 Tax=Pyrococcus yayanosii (strain CH1 / JCM 16557) TaxID=529709 RepID=F8AGL1_PYRYC|nr:hypothetical protein [Pyrococcus yayanosii]AEH23982.1 hypothetical protein PYCH_02850 [Pyrococcus yayanosii CH1]
MRIRASIIPLIILTLLLSSMPYGALLVPLAVLSLFSYLLGVVFLGFLLAFLIFEGVGGAPGVFLVSMALLTVEVAHLDRARAIPIHYAWVIFSVFLSLPLYLLIRLLSYFAPSLEVTALATLFLLVLYVFSREVMLK